MSPGTDGSGRLYCGRRLGTAAIPGSDGQCGPDNGPQCRDCVPLPAVTNVGPSRRNYRDFEREPEMMMRMFHPVNGRCNFDSVPVLSINEEIVGESMRGPSNFILYN